MPRRYPQLAGVQLADAGNPRPMARLASLVYALVLLTTVGQVAIVPLLPQYGERFGVGAVGTGWLLASVSVATLAVGFPAGALADRIGARRLTLVAGWLLVAT